MGEFKSIGGVWHPKQEKNLALKNKSDVTMVVDGKDIKPGEDFIYNGPDREAKRFIIEEEGPGSKTMGRHFTRDPEFIKAVKTMGFNNAEEYLKFIDYDEDVLKKKESELLDEVSHQAPEEHEETLISGGGKDMSGTKANDSIGGFGDERLRPATEVPKRGRGRPKK